MRRVPFGTMRTHRRILTLAMVGAAITGCSIASPDADGVASVQPTATASAAATTVPPDVVATTSAPYELLDRWTGLGEGTEAVAAFRTSFDTVDHYRVRRDETVRTNDGILTAHFVYLIDEEASRDQATLTYFVSDPDLWSQFFDEAEIDLVRTHELELVSDYSDSPPKVYLTYTGVGGWDGTWLDLGTGSGGLVGLGSHGLTPAAHTAGLLGLLVLEPVSFADYNSSERGSLQYDVPGPVAAGFLASNLAAILANAGVDASTLTAGTHATVKPTYTGGVEVSMDLSPLLQEAAGLVDDSNVAAYLNSFGLSVDVIISDIDTGDRVDLPSPDSIVIEPPSNA